MINEIDTTQFDAMNSEDIIARGARLIKQRALARLEKATKFKNPHQLPKEKDIKSLSEDTTAVKKVIDAVTTYWQEEAFNVGYKKALNEIVEDIHKLSM